MVYRVAKARHARDAKTMLNGQGAREWGGRFNSPGTRAVYCASTLSLAALEILVHAPRVAVLPDYRYLEIELPDSVIERVEVAPDPEDSAAFGNARLGVDGVPGFSVPSFVLTLEAKVIVYLTK